MHLINPLQNPARGFSRGSPNSAQASPQPVGSPPQRNRRAPEVQGQTRCRSPSLDGGPEPLWLLSITILIKYPYSLNATYKPDQCRDMSLPIIGASSRINTSTPIFGCTLRKEKLDHIVENRSNLSNLEQILQTSAAYFDNSKVLSTHSPASDPIDVLKPMIPMPLLVFATA